MTDLTQTIDNIATKTIGKDWISIWPVYIDSSCSYSNGRRFPLSQCVWQPAAADIAAAAHQLGYECAVEVDKLYSRDPAMQRGRARVNSKDKKKAEVIREIVNKMHENGLTNMPPADLIPSLSPAASPASPAAAAAPAPAPAKAKSKGKPKGKGKGKR